MSGGSSSKPAEEGLLGKIASGVANGVKEAAGWVGGLFGKGGSKAGASRPHNDFFDPGGRQRARGGAALAGGVGGGGGGAAASILALPHALALLTPAPPGCVCPEQRRRLRATSIARRTMRCVI